MWCVVASELWERHVRCRCRCLCIKRSVTSVTKDSTFASLGSQQLGNGAYNTSWKTARTEMKNPVWSTGWPATTAIRLTSAKPGAQRAHALRNMLRTSGTDALTCRPPRTTRSSTNTAFHSRLFRSTTSPVLPGGEWKRHCTSAQKRTRWTKTED